MCKFVTLTIFVLTISACIFAQANQDCPSISFIGPARIIAPGETGTYSAQIGETQRVLQYHWSVSAGEIVSGQGTKAVTVKPASDILTVTLDVRGLPSGCLNSASESAQRDLPPQPILLDEFSPIKDPKSNAARVAKIALNAKQNPNSQLYVLIYFRSGTSASSQAKQIAQLRSELTKNTGFDPNQITFVTTFSDSSRVKFFLVPPGASNPQP